MRNVTARFSKVNLCSELAQAIDVLVHTTLEQVQARRTSHFRVAKRQSIDCKRGQLRQRIGFACERRLDQQLGTLR